MGSLLFGTSGYSYKDWEGVLYPSGTRQADYLGIYAQEFDLVELNFSYYRMPDAALSRRMAACTGDAFTFTIKGHKSLTHEGGAATVQKDAEQFIRGIDPLVSSGKCAAILMQFPFSFHYTDKNRTYVDTLSRQFGELPLAIEFRNRDWQRQSVYEGLRDRNITLVNVDEPRLPGLPEQTSLVTAENGYVRFHGRNKVNWWKGDNVSRYDYCYSNAELKEWVPRIKAMALQAATIMVVFNNHSKGQAVQNVRRLREMFEQMRNKE
jgi:uncharacterized protein YecE (DUF72 family)